MSASVLAFRRLLLLGCTRFLAAQASGYRVAPFRGGQSCQWLQVVCAFLLCAAAAWPAAGILLFLHGFQPSRLQSGRRTRQLPVHRQPPVSQAIGSLLEQLAAEDQEELEEELAVKDFFDKEETETGIDTSWYDELPAAIQKEVENTKSRMKRTLEICKKAGHTPVLLNSLELFFPPELQEPDGTFNGTYLDCTFGRGGYSGVILDRLSPHGRLIAFDVDPTAAALGRDLAEEDARFTFIHRPFSDLNGMMPNTTFDGVVLDIGVSNPQIDNKQRGFSLQNLNGIGERPLDLRMNPTFGSSVPDWLMNTSVEELAWVIKNYGAHQEEDLVAERIAQVLLDEQEENGPYHDMRRFAETIVRGKSLVGDTESYKHPISGIDHPARLTVAALRLWINQELQELESVLPQVFDQLAHGGRCICNVFKLKEQQVVNKFILHHEEPDPLVISRIRKARRARELYPLLGTDLNYSVSLLVDPMKPSNAEVKGNRRARSGNMYVMEKAPRMSKMVKARPRLMRNRLVPPKAPVLLMPPLP